MDYTKGGNDAMIKNLQDFGITEEQFRQLMADYPKSAEFLEQHIREDDTLDFLGNQALVEMIKNNQAAMLEDNDFMNSPEKQNDEINSEAKNETEIEYELTEDVVEEDNDQSEENSSENKPALKEEIAEKKQTANIQRDGADPNKEEGTQKTKQKRRRKTVAKPAVDIPSAIDRVPATDLRKFYAQNFTIKPEKIFYLDDETIRKNVKDKFFCLEMNDRFVFFKKNTIMISIDKKTFVEAEENRGELIHG